MGGVYQRVQECARPCRAAYVVARPDGRTENNRASRTITPLDLHGSPKADVGWGN